MEADDGEGQYSIKGGKTFLGRMFAYQERTGMSPKQILEIPYVQFVIGMLDAPQTDYKSKDKKKTTQPSTAAEELAAFAKAF